MDFTHKARFVAGGHLTDPPKESVYSSIVSRENVRLFFLIAALNDLDVLASDVQNVYLNAGTKEQNWFVAGLEFGLNNVGKPLQIVKALYGLRSDHQEHNGANTWSIHYERPSLLPVKLMQMCGSDQL